VLHTLALLLPAPLRPLACRILGHAWVPVAVAETPAPGFRVGRRALVTIHARCNVCEREAVRHVVAGRVRAGLHS
jgi:hypothetical protein